MSSMTVILLITNVTRKVYDDLESEVQRRLLLNTQTNTAQIYFLIFINLEIITIVKSCRTCVKVLFITESRFLYYF